MCKEHVLAEFDAIKATINIIDKRKGEVSTSCLEKELDIVKDRIAILEKCFKLRYHDTSKDFVKQVCYKQHDFHYSKSDSAVSDVFHQEVASEKRDWPGEASGFIYAQSQDKRPFYSLVPSLQFGAAVAGGLTAEKGKRKHIPTAADESTNLFSMWK
nr:hypothetical protein [Tanacetum cinerariifolium]